MISSFQGKVALITGASTGIGRATAIAFRQAGARVVLAARSQPELEALATELGGPAWALAIPMDVADPAQCQALIERSVAHFGAIDILINNAGMIVSGRFEHLQPGDMERQFAVNFMGLVYCTQAALPQLKASRGVIVNVSSVAGFFGLPSSSAYAASKAAVNSLSRALRVELRRYGIGVVTLCPYFTSGAQLSQKGIIRQGSLHTPDAQGRSRSRQAPGRQTTEQVAAAILRAAGQRPRLVVLSWPGQLVWRLERLAPGLIDAVIMRVMGR